VGTDKMEGILFWDAANLKIKQEILKKKEWTSRHDVFFFTILLFVITVFLLWDIRI
jgi:hypothetical protein